MKKYAVFLMPDAIDDLEGILLALQELVFWHGPCLLRHPALVAGSSSHKKPIWSFAALGPATSAG